MQIRKALDTYCSNIDLVFKEIKEIDDVCELTTKGLPELVLLTYEPTANFVAPPQLVVPEGPIGLLHMAASSRLVLNSFASSDIVFGSKSIYLFLHDFLAHYLGFCINEALKLQFISSHQALLQIARNSKVANRLRSLLLLTQKSYSLKVEAERFKPRIT